MRKRLAGLALSALITALAATACSLGGSSATPSPVTYAGWPPGQTFDLIPVPVSTELAVGPNRLLVNLLDASTNASIASPDRPVQLRLYDLAASPATPNVAVDAAYLPTIPALPGLYRAMLTFDRAGDWGLEAITTEADGSQRSGRFIFDVRESSSTPAVGASVPASDTPAATDAAGIAAISTDDDPDPDFYATSVAGALAAHQPFALVFATPAFCRSATCGPTLDIVKSVAPDYKNRLTFIHVEPYQLETVDGHLKTVLTEDNNPIPVTAVDEWGLPTEPYVFLVDAQGKLAAKFEGIVSADELRAAFDALLN
jgi:hypothetical protein